jgi:hypothetical protein
MAPRRPGTHALLLTICVPLLFVALLLGWFQSTPAIAAANTSKSAPPLQEPVGPQTPDETVRRAWELAQISGVYDFRTDVSQTTDPAQSLQNAGKDARLEQFFVEGTANRLEESLFMQMWRSGQENQAISVQFHDGKSFGRVGNGEWEEVNGLSDLFAPGGDPLALLAGAEDIRYGGEETRSFRAPMGTDGVEIALTFTRYDFDFNGPGFAEYLRVEMERQLLESGELPGGVNLQASDQFRKTTGSGEVWVDEYGLPRFITLNMDFPRQPNGDQINAEIRSEFFDFDTSRIATSQASLIENPAAWLDFRTPATETAWTQARTTIAFWGMMAAIAFLSLKYWHSKKLYYTVALFVILSMLLSPLLQSQQTRAFYDGQQEKVAENEVQQEEIERKRETEQIQEAQIDPHQNQLETPSAYAVEKATKRFYKEFDYAPYGISQQDLDAAILRVTSEITTTDSDDDGLSDVDEVFWQTCAYLGAPQYCDGVVDSTDSDGDGLGDGQEVNFVGTEPSNWDTDGDGITDTVEVVGYTDSAGVFWSLDPRESDSNNDGRQDGQECLIWTNFAAVKNPGAPCPDTDGDGTPDIFDDDNDGDGVKDDVDLSANSAPGVVYNRENPLEVRADNLETNEPTYLDVQLRPTNSDNLTLFGHIIDWPSNDSEGQIQRVLSTTWATVSDPSIQSNGLNADNGDVRLVPMMEILIPYEAGHYGNLPVLPAYEGISRTLGTTVEQWLDTSEISQYGISVQDVGGGTGDLVVYVPVNLVNDGNNGGPVAFSAKMLYWPEQGVSMAYWGQAHEVHLVWFVQLITDACRVGAPPLIGTGNLGVPEIIPGACAPEDREEWLTVAHLYDDDYQLVGLSLTQDFGLKVGLMYEDPDLDSDVQSDDYLWAASWFLNSQYLRGVDCPVLDGDVCDAAFQDGVRDVSIDTALAALDDWSANTSNLNMETFDFVHEGYIAHIWMTHTVALLEDEFNPLLASEPVTPTLITLRESTKRSLNLDDISQTGNLVTMDLDPSSVSMVTMAGMNWGSFYDADPSLGVLWESYALEEYLEYLDWQLLTDDFFRPESSDQVDQDVAEGKRIWAEFWYSAMHYGSAQAVEIDGVLAWIESPDIPESGGYGRLSNGQLARYRVCRLNFCPSCLAQPGRTFPRHKLVLRKCEIIIFGVSEYGLH